VQPATLEPQRLVRSSLKALSTLFAAYQARKGSVMQGTPDEATSKLGLGGWFRSKVQSLKGQAEQASAVLDKDEELEPWLQKLSAGTLRISEVPQHLRNPQTCLAAVRSDGSAIYDLTEEERTPAVCMALVERWGEGISALSDAHRSPVVCLAALNNNWRAVDELTPEQCAQPGVADWVHMNWDSVRGLVGQERAAEIQKAIADAEADNADPFAAYDRQRSAG
jgi:hypothetical protein